jgi:hypothetical protein
MVCCKFVEREREITISAMLSAWPPWLLTWREKQIEVEGGREAD